MLKKIFSKISLDLWIFFIFLLCLGIEKKHVFTQAIPTLSTGFIHNLLITYNPWKSIEIYLTDIVFLVVVVFWLIRVLWQKTHRATRTQAQPMPRPVKYALASLGLFWPIAAISLWQNGFNFSELFGLAKLIEFGLLFLYVLTNIDNLVKLLYTIGAFLSGTILQAIVGIAQYFSQQSCGLKWFGEPDLSPFIQNVAKIVVDGVRTLRAYGTLPHANVLGGYVVVGVLLLITLIVLIYSKMFFGNGSHSRQSLDQKTVVASDPGVAFRNPNNSSRWSEIGFRSPFLPRQSLEQKVVIVENSRLIFSAR